MTENETLCPRCGYPNLPLWRSSTFDYDREIAPWDQFEEYYPELARKITPGQDVQLGEYTYRRGIYRKHPSRKIQRILTSIYKLRPSFHAKPKNYLDLGEKRKTLFDHERDHTNSTRSEK